MGARAGNAPRNSYLFLIYPIVRYPIRSYGYAAGAGGGARRRRNRIRSRRLIVFRSRFLSPPVPRRDPGSGRVGSNHIYIFLRDHPRTETVSKRKARIAAEPSRASPSGSAQRRVGARLTASAHVSVGSLARTPRPQTGRRRRSRHAPAAAQTTCALRARRTALFAVSRLAAVLLLVDAQDSSGSPAGAALTPATIEHQRPRRRHVGLVYARPRHGGSLGAARRSCQPHKRVQEG